MLVAVYLAIAIRPITSLGLTSKQNVTVNAILFKQSMKSVRKILVSVDTNFG